MNTVTCPICNKSFNRINNAHLRMHRHTFASFKEIYPNAILDTPELRKKYGTQSATTRNKIKQQKNKQKQNRQTLYYQHPKLCKQCNSILTYEQRRYTFCGSSCSSTYTNLHNPSIKSPKAIEKLRIRGKTQGYKNFANVIRHKFEGHKNCAVCNSIFSITSQSKKRILCGSPICKSKWCSEHNFRQNKTRGKCGEYRGIWCASSWELAFVAYHLYHNNPIKRYPNSFLYELNGKTHRYFPDFIIGDIIYEIKGRMTDDVPIKTQAVQSQNINIELITRAEILPIIAFVKKQFNVKNVTELYGGSYQS